MKERLKKERLKKSQLKYLFHSWIFFFALMILGVFGLIVSALFSGRDEFWKSLLADLGTALVVTGLVSFIFERGLDEFRSEWMAERLRDVLAKNSPEYGLAGLEHRVKYEVVLGKLQPEQELWWLESFIGDFPYWKPHILAAIANKATVHILMLSSEAPALESRLAEVSDSIKYDLEEARQLAKTYASDALNFRETHPDAKKRFELRTYNGLPCAPMIIISNKRGPVEAYSSYFLLEPSHDMPYLVWTEGKFVAAFAAYFKAKWNAASPQQSPEDASSTQDSHGKHVATGVPGRPGT